MLVQFSCANHRSIKQEVVFSFLASSGSNGDARYLTCNGLPLLRLAAIYGANGSGKTTLLQAVTLLTQLVTQSIRYQPGDALPYFPHKQGGEGLPTELDIQFCLGDVRFAYGVSYTREAVVRESLHRFVEEDAETVFERDADGTVAFGEADRAALEPATSSLKPNRLFLSCAANFSRHEDAERIFLYFKDDLVTFPGNESEWMQETVRALREDEEAKAFALRFLRRIGSGIVGIRTEPLSLSEDAATYRVLLKYPEFDVDLAAESRGLQKLVELLCPLYYVLRDGKVLLWDELESSLHPVIVTEVLRLFLDGEYPRAQVLFTTHDINLLDLRMLRRDQIWFTETRPEDRSTDLYSLLELAQVRKDENVRRGYLAGRYGAIPFVNADGAERFQRALWLDAEAGFYEE